MAASSACRYAGGGKPLPMHSNLKQSRGWLATRRREPYPPVGQIPAKRRRRRWPRCWKVSQRENKLLAVPGITGEHIDSNQDQVCLVKILQHIGFRANNGSRLLPRVINAVVALLWRPEEEYASQGALRSYRLPQSSAAARRWRPTLLRAPEIHLHTSIGLEELGRGVMTVLWPGSSAINPESFQTGTLETLVVQVSGTSLGDQRQRGGRRQVRRRLNTAGRGCGGDDRSWTTSTRR